MTNYTFCVESKLFLSRTYWKILHLTEFVYTTSGCDGCDNYQVWPLGVSKQIIIVLGDRGPLAVWPGNTLRETGLKYCSAKDWPKGALVFFSLVEKERILNSIKKSQISQAHNQAGQD